MSEEKPDIRELIEQGSLGTPEAKALRATVSPEEVQRVLDDDGYCKCVLPRGHESRHKCMHGWRP